MTFSLNVEVAGLSSALKELGQIDQRLRIAAQRQLEDALEPMIEGARAFVPEQAPLSGWNRGYFEWNPAKIRGRIYGKVNTRKSKGGEIRLAYLKFNRPEGSAFDMAGRGPMPTEQGQRMAASLTKRFGPPSRVMWRAYGVYQRLTENALVAAVRDMEKTIDRSLGRNR